MTLEEFSNKLYESKILHDYKDGKIDYKKVHDWIISQEEAIIITPCCMGESEQLVCNHPKRQRDYYSAETFKCWECKKIIVASKNEIMSKEQNLENKTKQCTMPSVRRSFSHTKVNLRDEDIEGMISTYEFLVWNNEGEEKEHCQRVLRKLKKAINYACVD